MKAKNGDPSKSANPVKTPPGRKPAPAKATPDSAAESASLSTQVTTRGSAAKAKLANNNENTPSPIVGSDSKPEQSPGATDEQVNVSTETTAVTSGEKAAPRTRKVVRKIVRRVLKKAPASAKTPATAQVFAPETPKVVEAAKDRVEESTVELGDAKDPKDFDHVEKDDPTAGNAGDSSEKEQGVTQLEEATVKNAAEDVKEAKTDVELEGPGSDPLEREESTVEMGEKSAKNEQTSMEVDVKPNEVAKTSTRSKEPGEADTVEEVNRENVTSKEEPRSETTHVEETEKSELQEGDSQVVHKEHGGSEALEEYGDRVDFGDHGEDDFIEEDPEELPEELEEERRERTAAANKRKIKKEYEIFVGGLDRDATEDDLKKVFEKIGEVVEVRLHKNLSSSKNKGYAFVKFANKEHAKHALSEMKNPVIRGKRCGTAPSEDNDTLFLGNICNTWTKEAIRQKLKEYGVEGVENITLVADVQHEGRSRGFAFLEFSCHADAMLAFKRLQKPDVVFGHTERTAKVAFAEPIREPDPEVMAQLRVKARLSNPMPKTQAVKGGMFGGFYIGHTGGGNFSRSGRGFGRVGHGGYQSNWANFQRGRGFYQHARGQTSRMGPDEPEYNRRYGVYPARQMIGRGGRRGPLRGSYHPAGREVMAAGPSRHNNNRPWHDAPERGHGDHISSRRQPFPPEEVYDRPFVGRHFDDPYFYDDAPHGMKRPFYMTDHDPDYSEPSRLRPRFDYPDPSASFRGTRYHDTYGAGNDPYRHEFYGPDYGSYPPYYGSDRPYGGGYYY
ncbi:hypothetical protein Tsubulata_006803 [Turnera subulata]|uniref:RRM domain-containing protein n=1 Tax=Turnera subulata TaxID=218843 RepID=A0A9Q0J481_9ROSI|nr:hypothetical protein Tsubulata_006803 [Turnera subulata]